LRNRLFNRAQAALASIRKVQQASGLELRDLPGDLRISAMSASMDAPQAISFDDTNSKAWLRRGQALLALSAQQQAVRCLQRASRGKLPKSLMPELDQSLKYSGAVVNETISTPPSCQRT